MYSANASAYGGNFVPHLTVAPLTACAERGRAGPSPFHFVVPYPIPPLPLRGSLASWWAVSALRRIPRSDDCRKRPPHDPREPRSGNGAEGLHPLPAGRPPLPTAHFQWSGLRPTGVVPCFSCGMPQRASPPVAGCPQMHSPDGRGLPPPTWRWCPRCTSRCIQYRTSFLPEIILIPVVYLYLKT